MLSKVISSSFLGVNGYLVNVEVDVSNGLPTFSIVGLGDTAVQESRERVRAAIKNTGFELLPQRITVNLSPADIRKEGSSYDLPVAIGILASLNCVIKDKLCEYMILGELSLSGEIKRVKGIINSVITAKENKLKGIILPVENCEEASIIKGIEIIPVSTLKETVQFLNGEIELSYKREQRAYDDTIDYDVDFKDVKGQLKAKRAMEIAAAGGHNIYIVGTPGCGKSMLSKRLPTILPDMTEEEIIETTKIYSIAGLLTKNDPVIKTRPFRSPHHTASDISLIGGGKVPKPGEISLAHNGVLFLDEMPEFSRQVLEVLRQPLEDKVVSVARVNSTLEFPANFSLIAASNPCHCGFLYEDNDSPKTCSCSAVQIQNYQKKLSGPIIDRMDLYLEMKRLKEDELVKFEEGEDSAAIKKRVEKARAVQRKRYKSHKTNANMSASDVKKYCKLDSESETLLKSAAKNLGLSGRGFDKILRVARTIADIEGNEKILKGNLLEAIGYRKN